MDVHIRKATMKDLSQITEMSAALIRSDGRFDHDVIDSWSYGEHGQAYLKRRIRGRKGVCFVAEADGKLVGYTTGGLASVEKWRPVKRSELDNLFVADGYRNNGVGPKLIVAFREWSQKKGVDRIFLLAVAQNKDALRFYEKNGFKPHLVTFESDV